MNEADKTRAMIVITSRRWIDTTVNVSGAGRNTLDADQEDCQGVTDGGTNTSFAHQTLGVLVEQETFAIVYVGQDEC